MASKGTGTLIIIGGHEDKTGAKPILTEVAERVGSGTLVVTTVASKQPNELFKDYDRAFRSLGVKHLAHVALAVREEARAEATVKTFKEAAGVFFTGGDQLKVTSQIGDTPVFEALHELYQKGGVIAGTSAGASVMCETMLVAGDGDDSPKIGNLVQMAPGFALVKDMIVDQHFAQRGRMGRLLGAVSQNPRVLGVGIDENTAIILERGRFYVVGAGAVYVLDGSPVTESNVADAETDRCLSIFDVKLHVLSQGDQFHLQNRRPDKISRELARKIEREEATVR